MKDMDEAAYISSE